MKKVGLIAGSGKFPLLFAQNAAKNGCCVYTIALKEETNKDIEKANRKIVVLEENLSNEQKNVLSLKSMLFSQNLTNTNIDKNSSNSILNTNLKPQITLDDENKITGFGVENEQIF